MLIYVPSKRIGNNGYVDDHYTDEELSQMNPGNIKWCQYCAHYGYIGNYNACADGNWFKILRNGPSAVAFCGYCNHFVNKSSEEGKQASNYSNFKRNLLKGMGFHQKGR